MWRGCVSCSGNQNKTMGAGREQILSETYSQIANYLNDENSFMQIIFIQTMQLQEAASSGDA